MAVSLDLSSSLRSLSARDRRTLLVGGVIAAILFVFVVILPLDRSVSHLKTQVAGKQADLVWMRSAAPEIAVAGPVRSHSGESLIVIVDESARESGLGGSLAGSEPSGQGSLRVELDKAPFDAMVGWLARLGQQNGVEIESATVNNAGQPGIVSASLVLKRP
jgi:general secretion pathway protein M